MSVISRKLVKARKPYRCDARSITFPCKHDGTIHTGDIYVRLYGNGCDGDPKYVLRLHPNCEDRP